MKSNLKVSNHPFVLGYSKTTGRALDLALNQVKNIVDKIGASEA